MRAEAMAAWIDCAAPGCPDGIQIDPRHWDNLTASGGWYCPHHDEVTR